MSLLVWLPLNGTLENKGLKGDVTVTNNGATVSDNGKIGKCYSFGNGSASSIGINIDNNFVDIGASRSICAWVKPKGNHSHYSGSIVSSGNWNGKCWAFCLKQDNTGFTGFDNNYSGYYYTDIPINTWTHLCVTVEGNVTKFYKNGVYLGQRSRGATFQSDATNTMIGRVTYGSYFTFNGDINDFRIYDHCLSAKEVHEIAKGLVLHYKLDQDPLFGKNLLPTNMQRNQESGSSSSNEYFNLFDATTIWDTYGLVPYTVSFDAKAKIAHSFNLYGNYGNGPKYMFTNTSINVDTEWKRFSYTFTPRLNKESGTWSGCSIYGIYGSGAIVSVRRVKLELGSIATPMDYDPEVVVDTSGYGNDGVINGDIVSATDTPRYESCVSFTNNDYIRSSKKANEFLPHDAITVNLWIKPSTWGNPISCTQNGGWNFEATSSGAQVQFPVYSGGYKIANSGIVSSTLLNNWHMLTGTFDSSSVNIYIDGELKKTTSHTSTAGITYNANNYLFIAAEASATDVPESKAYAGQISDLRIYSTALSAEDVKELYDTSAFIDNKYNVETYEFVEDSAKEFTKTGLAKFDLEEVTGQTNIYKTGKMTANQLIEI